MENLVFKSNDGQPVTNSLLVAEKFEKRHSDVLEAIRNLTAENSAVKNMFVEATYVSEPAWEKVTYRKFAVSINN